jgi:hypothetical protein
VKDDFLFLIDLRLHLHLFVSRMLAAPLAMLLDGELSFGGFLVSAGIVVPPFADGALHAYEILTIF